MVPIPGTRKRSPLEENIAAASLDLDAEDVAAIEAAVRANAIEGERYNARELTMVNL
jgi:aryl-alcohol dehydrogenase-like predicted oxidoreductase